ncbi:DNA-directed RNA polymerases I, II, and III subunit RPABC3 [Nematocida sp. LUAm3]|nr:DNA-directed RNA polymerases I, II, and III subunit RPABC3 [Nematocida sp. LUAm3]KAI5176004.1 DNA-directed RNA polymerases I, II, and III subunit RPABC3 [Nematocida sp. LUAm2]KAI5179101.1 DNA-directed RNA polymerases I, II, and III subunit RPABC3 [Nematocida sp. LUAm1]
MKLFSDVFTLKEIDPQGKVFDSVSRGVFQSDSSTMHLDYHSELLSCRKMDQFTITLFSDENNFSDENIPSEYAYLTGNGVFYKKEEKENLPAFTFYFSGLFLQIITHKNILKYPKTSTRFYLGIIPH